jgi:hypothetical protein
VAIQTEDPAALYHYFAEVFKLPPFVPLIEYPILTSASVLITQRYKRVLARSQSEKPA